MRATIYARYSSELQRETSIDDQVRVCRARAEREGWAVASVHSDSAVSGTVPVDQRAGGRELLAEVVVGDLQVLLLEGLDRLSRDQVEQERIVRRLEYHGVRIVGVSDGYDSASAARKVLRGVRGLINELYLDDLKAKVHRGQAGQFGRGLAAAQSCYGYRLVAAEGGSRYEIDEDQARWVRWIYQQYAAGEGIRPIAHRLNELGVPAPRGGCWDVSTIYGSPQRRSGILNRLIYGGQQVWNKTRAVVDPDTGRKRYVLRPVSEWLIRDAPELRIVDQATWDAVRARVDHHRDTKTGRKPTGRPATALLTGILCCPKCGATMIARNQRNYRCGAHLKYGPAQCDGSAVVPRQVVERRLLTWVRDELLTPEAAAAYEAAFRDALAAGQPQMDEAALRQRVRAIEAEIRRLVDAIAELGVSRALANRLGEAEAELEGVQQTLQALRRAPREVPDVRAIFTRQLMDLSAALADSPQRARAALREILGEVHLQLEQDALYASIATTRLALVAAGGSVGMATAPTHSPCFKRVRIR